MIQRVQTLFLAGIVIVSVLLLFIPFEQAVSGENKFLLNLMPGCLKDMVKPFIYVPIGLNFLVMALSVYTVFKYKHRKTQMKFAQLLMALSALLMGSLFAINFLNLNETAVVDIKPTAFIPVVNIILAFLARMFIKKDEDLVRSADRIR